MRSLSFVKLSLAMTAGLTLTVYLLYAGGKMTRTNANQIVNIAHLGNSFQFVNDLPRVLEAMGQGRIRQDSVLHGSLSFVTLPRKGNGMWNKWQNRKAYNDTTGFYDFGACSVVQLLYGYDEKLYDFDTYYYDDGKNPCVQDPNYLTFRDAQPSSQSPVWDFVIINDQSVRPAIYEKALTSAKALKNKYAPLLEEIEAVPVLIHTWGYDADSADNNANMANLVDVPTFTNLLLEGYQLYAETLKEVLPVELEPRIAPVGLAFLTVWEENFPLWKKLFGADLYHPSPHGTYLEACVIYATIYRRAPDPPTSLPVEVLFNRTRSRAISGDEQPLPTDDEALYLRWIAQRVALKGHVPKSLTAASSGSFGS